MLLQGKVAAYVASDLASTMTAATVNISAGALMDYEPDAWGSESRGELAFSCAPPG